jgi:hypothetical protein
MVSFRPQNSVSTDMILPPNGLMVLAIMAPFSGCVVMLDKVHLYTLFIITKLPNF